MTIRVAALYRFARFPQPEALRAPLLALCSSLGVRGTLLLAREGINGTIAGAPDAIDAVLAHIRTLPDCAALEAKFADAATMPFHRMKVRIKREIVTMGVADIDPLASVGTYVAPADWNALIEAPDTVIVDTRNDYEVKLGSFAGAIDPKTRGFSDFPAWVEAHKDDLAGKRVAMFCTGGIRCEKATAYLLAQGLGEVYHLQGGILKYLEEIPAENSRWNGECFVFDERVSVGHGLVPGTHGLCRACRMPVSQAERASPLFEEGISCPACHGTRTDEQRAAYAERHRQVLLAEARGQAHVGAVPPLPHKHRQASTA
ncbi:MAG: rhodanese-related sulfurtransferase [Sphingomonas sp.]|jgi:UPF0176 protein